MKWKLNENFMINCIIFTQDQIKLFWNLEFLKEIHVRSANCLACKTMPCKTIFFLQKSDFQTAFEKP